MRTVDLPYGVATAIGSLPHADACAAVEFALEHQPRLPAAPSLPNRSGYERMVAQAAWGISGVVVLPDGSLEVDDPNLVDPAEPLVDPGIDGEPFVTMRAFLAAVGGRTGPIKLQLTGPVTLGLALHAVGVPTICAFAVAGAAVRARARALVEAARAAAPLATPVVFVDEPGLTAAMHPGFPLGPNATIDLVSSALAALEPHAITGLHCCGRADWRVVLQSGPQVVSMPVESGAVAHSGALGAFLDSGGWIAWGATPTDGPVGSSADRLWRRLSNEWCDLVQRGCDPVLLREQAMVTPACGLALHGIAQAEHVLSITGQVARRLETQMHGLRLTVGA
jgi:methionine synthase II (cobalamin-independent)